ncbi:DUF1028 domain-containing protein [Rhodococcus hoagii]|nr:DUF1028 domain-containing protein [Prescottella equi]
MRALEAGLAAGGEPEPLRSACLRVHGSEQFPLVDLRVDEHRIRYVSFAGSGSCTALRPASMSAAQSIPTPHVVSPQERRKPMPELTRTPASVPELAALLAPRLPDILDLATRLTEVESGSFLPAGVDRVSDLVAERLAALGFTSRRHTIASGRGRAFEATLETGSPGLRLLVLGHADTVWPEERRPTGPS